jgi:chain length determinant protein tyrosine kinase EpsG
MSRAVHELREPTLRSVESGAGAVDDRPIGRILIDLRKLRERDLDRVLEVQRKRRLRFGETACRLGLVEEADVYYALSVQFNYPYLQRGQVSLGPDLIAAHDPYHPQSEAVREVRTQLITHWLGPQRKVLAVASADVGEGKSYLAANLAVSFAQMGEKTLLIDADLRAPRQHRTFGMGNAAGVAQVLTRRAGLEAAERSGYFDSLAVLPAGAAPPNPLELLSRGEWPRLLGEARRQYGLIVVDTTADACGSDARLVAARADGALLVARKNHTRLDSLERLRSAITASGVPVVGTVLNQT